MNFTVINFYKNNNKWEVQELSITLHNSHNNNMDDNNNNRSGFIIEEEDDGSQVMGTSNQKQRY